MTSSVMLRRVALVGIDVSEELTRATRHNIPEDITLHSHRRENFKSYTGIVLTSNSERFTWAVMRFLPQEGWE
jgi:hypothetical protein